MRVTLLIFSLVAGGAERVMATMANYWAERGWTVTLLTLDTGGDPPFYPLHPAVLHRPLGLANASRNPLHALVANLHRVRDLRRALRESQPDAIISLMCETNVLTLLAARGMSVPVLVQEQNFPQLHPASRAWRLLRSWTYPLATHVVVLNEPSLNCFPPAVRQRGHVIPNPAVIVGSPRSPASQEGAKTLIAMGRFVPQKGFDLLLQAFAAVAPAHRDWSLEIIGEGPMRAELEAEVARLGLGGRVRLPGVTKQPHDKLRAADLFVMSSRYEGFPLSLCEALACGLPAVSFDCPTGPGEIIRHGVDGLLVPPEDVAALSAALAELMGDPRRREALAARAPEVLDRFGLPRIMSLWEALLRP